MSWMCVYVVVVCETRVRSNATGTISLKFSENLYFRQKTRYTKNCFGNLKKPTHVLAEKLSVFFKTFSVYIFFTGI